jgi:1,4-alpha-glucan branching enzyme
MPGDIWRQFAGLRLLTLLQMTHPGKKLNFMGHENAPFIEWREYEELEWFMLGYENHAKYRDYIKDINAVYREHEALWSCENSWDGFKWIDADNNEQGILSYLRYDGAEQEEELLVVANVGLQSFDKFRIGVPEEGEYEEIFSTDDAKYGGNGRCNLEIVASEPEPMHGMPYSIEVKVPVLGGMLLKRLGRYEYDQDKS